MKKTLCLLLTLFSIFIVAACGNIAEEENKILDELAEKIKMGNYEITESERKFTEKALHEKEIMEQFAVALNNKQKGNLDVYEKEIAEIPNDYTGRLAQEIKAEKEKIYDNKVKAVNEQTKARNEEKRIENNLAVEESKRILNGLAIKRDEVEKITWYRPWGSGGYPAQDAVYWYVGEKDSEYWLNALLVHFDDKIDWVFWDKVIFSTNEGNWIYKIDCFAGQSGGGKDTQIVHGGKYETLNIGFNNLEPGYRLLVKGTNPIIRFQGENRHHDYYLTSDDINLLNTGIYLNEQLKKVNYRISK